MSGLARQVTKLNFATTEWNVALCSPDSGGLSGEDSRSCSMEGDLGSVLGILKCPVALTLLITSSIMPVWLMMTYGGSEKSITIPRKLWTFPGVTFSSLYLSLRATTTASACM
jgi:hypothetical protein